jgi:tetratricopeptide (TPR) repeat protein
VEKKSRIMTRGYEFHLTKGLNFLKREKYDDAIKSLQTAVEINPDSFEAQYLLGKCLMKKDCPKDALVYLEKAKALNPTDIETYYDLAIAHCRLREYDRSIEILQKAHSIDKFSMKIVRALGITYFKNSSFDHARRFFRKYFERNPDDIATMNLIVDSLVNNNQTEDALSYLREFIGFDNNYLLEKYDDNKDDLLFELGKLLLRQERYQETRDIFGSLFSRYPRNDIICRVYAWACADLIIQLCNENSLEVAKNELYSFLELADRYPPQEIDRDDYFYLFDKNRLGFPWIREYFEERFWANDNSTAVLKFIYKLGNENPKINLTNIFHRLIQSLIDNSYGIEDDDRPVLSDSYRFGLQQVSPELHIQLGGILIKYPEMKDIALIEFKKASESQNASWKDHFRIARYSINLDLDFAIRELNTAMQLNDTSKEIFYALSATMLRKGNLKEFSENLLIAINKDPADFEKRIERLIRVLQKSKWDGCQLLATVEYINSQLDSISYRFKNYSRVQSYLYFIQGFLYQREGDITKAIEYYNLSIKSNDKLICVLPYLGDLYLKEKDFHKAIIALTRGRDHSQNNSMTYKRCTELLAEMAFAQGNWRDAHTYFKELSKLYPNDETFYEKSLISYNLSQKITPDKLPILEEDLVKIKKELDQWEKNIRLIIIEKFPNFWEMMNNDEELKQKITQRLEEYISKKPFVNRNQLRPIDFFDVRDYQKIIKKNQELKRQFGSPEILKFNSDCIAELRNIIAHNRSFDFSDYYHGKAALHWFNNIFENITTVGR